MQEVTVCMRDDSVVFVLGEVMLDPVERSLIVQGEPGNYTNFNWDFVAYYEVSPHTEEDDYV